MHELTRKKLAEAAEIITSSTKWSVRVTTQSGEVSVESNDRMDIPPSFSLRALRGYLLAWFLQSADFDFIIGAEGEPIARKHEAELLFYDCKPTVLLFQPVKTHAYPIWLTSALKYLPSQIDINGAVRPEVPLATIPQIASDSHGIHVFFDKQWTAIELHDYAKLGRCNPFEQSK